MYTLNQHLNHQVSLFQFEKQETEVLAKNTLFFFLSFLFSLAVLSGKKKPQKPKQQRTKRTASHNPSHK